MERMGLEPISSARKADILPVKLPSIVQGRTRTAIMAFAEPRINQLCYLNLSAPYGIRTHIFTLKG